MAGEILIGYCSTERGDDALALGGALAEAFDATPVVATAVAYPGYLTVLADVEGPVAEAAEPVLERARERMAPLEIETRTVLDDSPGHALHELAVAERPVAVVVGSGHRGTLGRILLGSVGQALLSGAPCAVAVAPHGYAADPVSPIQRIAVGVAGTAESRSAVRAAGSLAERLDAELTMIAVAPAVPPDIGGAVLSILSVDELETSEGKRMEALLEEAAAMAPPGIPVRRRLLHGDPASALAEAASDFDLLVVGSRCYGPVRRALLGSVSVKLMRTAPAPVLVIPRGDGDDARAD